MTQRAHGADTTFANRRQKIFEAGLTRPDRRDRRRSLRHRAQADEPDRPSRTAVASSRGLARPEMSLIGEHRLSHHARQVIRLDLGHRPSAPIRLSLYSSLMPAEASAPLSKFATTSNGKSPTLSRGDSAFFRSQQLEFRGGVMKRVRFCRIQVKVLWRCDAWRGDMGQVRTLASEFAADRRGGRHVCPRTLLCG